MKNITRYLVYGLIVLACVMIHVRQSIAQRVAVLSHESPASNQAMATVTGAFEVASMVETWRDDARQRDIPVKIYYPADMDKAIESLGSRLPVIFFSHGLGGSRHYYAYLGNCWASHGFIVVHVQHAGSDEYVWRNNKRPMAAMREAAKDLDNMLSRPADIRFAVDTMLVMNQQVDSRFHEKIDPARLGAAGHSFGAYTVLAVTGQGSAQVPAPHLRDSRIKAIIPMSAPANQRSIRHKAFEPIAVPALHMTGTHDDSPIGGTRKEDRRVPFDQMHLADGYLLTLTNGDHMVFSGRNRRGHDGQPVSPANQDPDTTSLRQRDTAHQTLIQTASLQFWRAYLLDDAAAKAWLQGEGFKGEAKDIATLEVKRGE